MKTFRPSALTALLVALVASLVLTGPQAHAAGVTESNVPTQHELQAIFPAMQESEGTTSKARRLSYPKGCEGEVRLKGRSGYSAEYFNFDGRPMAVMTQVVELNQKKQAKKAIRGFRNFAAQCPKVHEDGTTITISSRALPKVGQQRVGMTMRTKESGIAVHTTIAIVRQGKQVAFIITLDLRKADAKFKKLVRLAAKKMR